METYISLVDSDSDDDVTPKSPVPAVLIDSCSENEPSQPRQTRARATRRGRARPARTTRAAAKKNKSVTIIEDDSNSNHSTSSGGALRETQVHTQSAAVSDSPLTDPVSEVVAQLSRGDTENVHPSDSQTKCKLKRMSDSDSTDSDFEGPVVKKPTKSRTIRRGLSKKNTIPENANQNNVNIETEDNHIYSTRVSSCMDALRKGKVKLAADLVESDEETDEAVALCKSGNLSGSRLSESADFDFDLDPETVSVDTPEKNVSIMIDRSPSPPPSPMLSITDLPRQSRLNANVRDAIRSIRTSDLSVSQSSSQDQDLIFDGEESPESNREILVKVRSRSGIQRLPMKMNDKFLKIAKEMAQHEGVKHSQIVMLRRGESILHEDSPASMKLHIADIIDCHIASEIGVNDQSFEVIDDDPSLITIYIQGQDLRSKTALKIRKDEKLEKLIQQYGQQLKKDVAKLAFQFDGDAITGDETADDLDIEDGDCIDAVDRQ